MVIPMLLLRWTSLVKIPVKAEASGDGDATIDDYVDGLINEEGEDYAGSGVTAEGEEAQTCCDEL